MKTENLKMIAIKDFKMPSCCYDCDFSIGVMSTEVDRECTITEKYVNDDDRPDWCPLVEVPDMNVGNCSEIPNNSDCVSRQAAIDAIRAMQTYKLFVGDDLILIDKAGVMTELMMMPSAQPEQTKMIKEIREWINSGNRGSADYFIVDKIEEIINKYE